MTKLSILLGSVAALALISGCCCGGGASSDDWEKAFDEAMDEAMEEAVEEIAEDVEAAAEGGASGPCGAYSKCCADYADALKGMAGYTEDSIQAIKDGCAMTEQMAGTPGGDDACQMALDGLKQGMDAMGAMPGWETPASCK